MLMGNVWKIHKKLSISTRNRFKCIFCETILIEIENGCGLMKKKKRTRIQPLK